MEAPLNTVKGIISERWWQQLEVGLGSENLEQIVSNSSESVIVVIRLVSGISTHEFDGGKAATSQEPAPKVVEEEAEAQKGVKRDKEAHQFVIVLIDVVIPDADNRDDHVGGTYPWVQDEQEEESLVFQSDTVVGENAVVAHLEDTLVAYGAMVSSSGLEVIAHVAFTIPEASEISYCFRAVFHKSLYVLL